MAEKLKTPNQTTLNIPSEVVDSDWRDDIDTDYATRDDVTPKETPNQIKNNLSPTPAESEATSNLESNSAPSFEFYGRDDQQEGEYISPDSVSRESLKQIKNFQVKLAFSGLSKFRKRELANL